MTARSTLLVNSLLVQKVARFQAVEQEALGRQIVTPAQLAARLGGGFGGPIPAPVLQRCVSAVLADPRVDMGDLEQIRDLPGMVRALTTTLRRVWAANLDLQARAEAGGDPRLAALRRVEQAVGRLLPPAQFTPGELVQRAIARVANAPAVLGPITLQGVPDLDPVWRPLLLALASRVTVTWQRGPSPPPAWVVGSAVVLVIGPAETPEVVRVSCANPRHEALEALRWARQLLASGRARPEDILLTAPTTDAWELHLSTMAADANLPLAFVSGRLALTTREGQAAAALAQVLEKGLSQSRVRRLLPLIQGLTPATETLGEPWHGNLSPSAPLLSLAGWIKAVGDQPVWPAGPGAAAALCDLLTCLSGGLAHAAAIGAHLLSGPALQIWEKALGAGPAAALGVTLADLRVGDTTDFNTAMVFCNAADGAAAPRPFVRLLGLTSRGWPRAQGEDPLLPTRLVSAADQNPVPVPERDRRDYRTLLRATARQVVLSRSRRDPQGRQHHRVWTVRCPGDRPLWPRRQQHRHRDGLSRADDRDLHGLARAVLAKRKREVRQRRHGFPRKLHQHVAALETRLAGRAVVAHLGELHALLGLCEVRHGSEVGAVPAGL